MMLEYNALTEKIRELQNAHRKMRNELFDSIAHERGLKGDDGSKAIVTRSRGNFQVRVSVSSNNKTKPYKKGVISKAS